MAIMTILELSQMVEKLTSTTKATPVPEANQIIVSFDRRPGVEVSLLTPYMQNCLNRGQVDKADLAELLLSIKRIAST